MNISALPLSRFALYFLAFICLSSMLSCSAEKRVLRQQKKAQKHLGKAQKFKNKKTRKLNKAGVEELAYDALSMRAKLNVNLQGKESKATAFIRIRRDSAIWISISKVNIEGLRAIITPDSIMALDRINKQYYSFGYKELKKAFRFSFDYHMLQAALTGEPYWPEDAKPRRQMGEKHIILKEKLNGLDLAQFVSIALGKLIATKASDKDNQELNIDYSEFEQLDSTLFPKKINAEVNYIQDELPQQLSFQLSYTKVALAPSSLKLPFRINSKYSRASLPE